MSDVSQGIEWPVSLSALVLCALSEWSPWENANSGLNADGGPQNAQSSQQVTEADLDVTLPLEASEDVTKLVAEINRLEELKRQTT